MGYSHYSSNAAAALYSSRKAAYAADPVAAVNRVFAATSTGVVDPSVDPKGVAVREARDSAAHPESNPVLVVFDQTGSMGEIPTKFAFEHLPKLMGLLTAKGYCTDPQICFAAIGDARCEERAPLTIGQFESGLEMDGCLTKLFLEGGGGGQNTESYELAIYFAARHTAHDSFEKRGKKGRMFIIGDESYYPEVAAEDVARYIGDKLQGDLSTKDVTVEAQRTWDIYRICVRTPGYPDGSMRKWKDLLGEDNVFLLQDPSAVCELIGATIGVAEGRGLDDVRADLVDAGSSAASADAATKALVPFASTNAAVATAAVSGALTPPTGDAGTAKRL